MHKFTAIIQKYASKGEKTGWTYIEIPPDILLKLKLKDKKPFRIKGVMDDVKFEKLSTYPVGDGQFIVAINTALRKKLGKNVGAPLCVSLTTDKTEVNASNELLAVLSEDKTALEAFKKQLRSHQNYFHRYVDSAKGADTKAGRIVNVINAMYRGQNYGEMIRSLKEK